MAPAAFSALASLDSAINVFFCVTLCDKGTRGFISPRAIFRRAYNRFEGLQVCANSARSFASAEVVEPECVRFRHTSTNEPETLLEVRDLTVRFHSPGGISVSAVRQISFKIGRGEVVGLVGESGCGKSTTALSLGRLLPPEKSAVSGSLKLRGRELLDLREKELEKVRGTEIAYVFQEPSLALHPLQRVRDQVSDVIRVHRHWSRKRCRDEAREMLRAVGLPDSERFSSAYPHQLSGGQRQRVVVALALACQPALIVADEPTASLDVLTQAEILSLFRQLKEKLGVAMLLITHNPAILVGLADRILVMYAGKIVEEGPFEEVIQEPLHPYTQGLLRSMLVAPAKINHSLKEALPEILGQPPDPSCLPAGCAFEPRCPERMNVCASQNPATASPRADREVSCFLYGGD